MMSSSSSGTRSPPPAWQDLVSPTLSVQCSPSGSFKITPYCSPDYDEIVKMIGGSGTGPPTKPPFGGKVTCHYCDLVLSSPCSWRVHMRELHMFSPATVKVMNPNERDPFERRFHCPTWGDSFFFEAPFRSQSCHSAHLAKAKLLNKFDRIATKPDNDLSPRPGTSSNSRSFADALSGSSPVAGRNVGPLPPSPSSAFPNVNRPSPGWKCPHCSFLARKSGGLRYHLHIKHRNVKTGPVYSDKRKVSPSSVSVGLSRTKQSAPMKPGNMTTRHPTPPTIPASNSGVADSKANCPSPPSSPPAPTSRNTPVTRCPDEIPENTCRRGNSLSILFPIMGKLACVENGCLREFSGETWTSVKQSLKRHVERDHRIQIHATYFWCSLCSSRIAKSPAGHSCLVGSSPIVPPATPFPWACVSCSASFPTEKGLQNHAAAHKKEEILGSGTRKQISIPRRRRRRGRIQGPTPPESEDEAVQVPSAPASPALSNLNDRALVDVLTPPDTNEDSESRILDPYIREISQLVEGEATEEAFQYLCSLSDQAVAEIQSALLPGPALHDSNDRRPVRAVDIEDPRTCQSLYRRNRRRAIREINGTSGERCDIGLPALEEYFANAWGSSSFSPGYYVQTNKGPSIMEGVNDDPVAQVRGPFAAEQLATDRSVLYYLQDLHEVPCGPTERLQRLDSARKGIKDLCIAWLDVTNAFGALPHQAIFEALKAAGVGPVFTNLVKDIYLESTTKILGNGGISSDINILSGVKQGCPVSGLLFDLCVDPAIRHIQGESSKHKVLAFADDVCLLADSPSELQGMLDSIGDQFAQIGLSLNPEKSVAFHLRGRSPVGLLPSPFTVGGITLKAVGEGEFHRFLGRPVGFNACPDYSKLNDLSKLGANILSSALAPWQRLDALKCFFFPALQFPMRTSQFKKTEWEEIDRALRREVKNTLGLPENAANEYLYGHRKTGSCGLPVAAEESDLNRIDTAFKLLTSRATVRARLRIPVANDEDLGSFLSGTSVAEVFDISNIWACARKASKRLRVTWEFSDSVPRLLYEDLTIKPIGRRKVIFSIRDRPRMARSGKLLSKPDQGKAMECVAQSAASSHFISDGAYTRFADWRFIHKARLNLLPLNGTQAWKSENDRACRRCNDADLETLPHVLNHCKGRSRGWQLRHNNIVDRIKKALLPKNTLVAENQCIGPDGLRPDLVFKNGRKMYIIDSLARSKTG
ncbi:Retrovirus-related Pol polyprotein type-1 like protein [Argiope bruennichi]|nr:Retrovirus-related Pol polyprotein type-1 like protein [Argiope bruennichi]